MKQALTLVMPALPQGRVSFLHSLMDRLSHYPREQFDITIARHIERRTLSQNALLWGFVYPQVLDRGGEQLRGWTATEMHEFMLGEHFGWRVLTIRNPRDATLLRPHTHHVPFRRSSRLTTKEFAEYVEFIVRFWAEHGIVIELPGDTIAAQHETPAQEVQAEPPLSASTVGGTVAPQE